MKELHSSDVPVPRTSADVANKATGAAESNAASPPVTAKDESNQPSSSLNEGTLKAAVATPQHDYVGTAARAWRLWCGGP